MCVQNTLLKNDLKNCLSKLLSGVLIAFKKELYYERPASNPYVQISGSYPVGGVRSLPKELARSVALDELKIRHLVLLVQATPA